MIDDSIQKQKVLPILVKMLNENASTKKFEFKFEDGFCDKKGFLDYHKHKNPKALMQAFDNEDSIFLMDLEFSFEENKYMDASKALLKNMSSDHNFNKLYKKIKNIWQPDKWDFTACLLSMCKIKNKKTFIITTVAQQVVGDLVVKGLIDGIEPIYFPDKIDDNDQSEETSYANTRIRLKLIADAINEYCLSLSYTKIEYRQFLGEALHLNVHENDSKVSEGEKRAIELLKGFLRMSGNSFDTVFLRGDVINNESRLQDWISDIMKEIGGQRDVPSLHVGWLIGYGIHCSLDFGKDIRNNIDSIWNPEEAMKIQMPAVNLFTRQKDDKQIFKETLERFCTMCLKLFKNDREIKNDQESNNLLTKVEFTTRKLSFFVDIEFDDLYKTFKQVVYDVTSSTQPGGIDKGGHDTSRAIYNFWSLCCLTTESKNREFFLTDCVINKKCCSDISSKFNIKKTESGKLEVIFGYEL